MEIYIEKQLINISYSLILGLILGALYDIIRITHILFDIASYSGERSWQKKGTVPFFIFLILDTAYMISVTLLYSFFNYVVNNGEFRVFILASVCAGFALYHATFGRIVMFFSEAIVAIIRRVLFYIIVIPSRFIFKAVLYSARFVYKNTFDLAVRLIVHFFRVWRTERCKRKTLRDIRNFFEELEEAK